MRITRPSKQRLFGDLSLTPEDIVRRGPKRPASAPISAMRGQKWTNSLARLKETRTSAGKKSKGGFRP